MSNAGSSAALDRASLSDLAKFFLRLGTTALAGQRPHIAIIWKTNSSAGAAGFRARSSRHARREQSDSRTKLQRTSNSHWLFAWRLARADCGGSLFYSPAACMVGVLAWAYVHFGKLPAISGILYGIKPVVIAVVFQALWGLGRRP